jgi:SET domain-containing protein
MGNLEFMIIPWLKINWISDEKGYGLFATRDIPKGTITFMQDGLDIVISPDELESISQILRGYVEKYSYEDFLGNRIISWDLGKYMNHDDDANTLSTGYGFEIAIRDILAGEEVTDDYRIFSTHHNTSDWHLNSTKNNVIVSFPEELEKKWDEKVLDALLHLGSVEQPLRDFVDEQVWSKAISVSSIPSHYVPVKNSFPLKYRVHMESIIPELSKIQ